ncbi:vWA domain-containing protein [Chryseobacterium polytrichastri]|nr:VWA domain-containing protein [Chryseobacterium polytrichastri]
MKYFSFLFMFLILSCNKSKISETKKELPQQNIALVVDASLSMISKDFEPDRITVLKDLLKNAVTYKKENQAFSIVVFAGNSYLICPITKDQKKLIAAIDRINFSPYNLKPGTNIPHALLNGLLSLKNEKSNKSIFIFSDGITYPINAYPLNIPIEEANNNEIKISSVIITPKDFTISPKAMDENGDLVFKKEKAKPIDTKASREISSKTGGISSIFYTNKELNNFNFQQLLSKVQAFKFKKYLYKTDRDKLSKIYKEIEMTNDSLAVIFK